MQWAREEYQLGRQSFEAVAHGLGSAGSDGHHEDFAFWLGLTVSQVFEGALVTHILGGFEHLPHFGINRLALCQLGTTVATGLGIRLVKFVL